MNTPSISINMVAVKVMRSYDYCHFEVVLTSANPSEDGIPTAQVDALRKEAARLVDKAVEQYKVAKSWAATQCCDNREGKLSRLHKLADSIRATPEHERTPEEKAIIKAIADESYAERRYDYQDDWRETDGYSD